MEVSEDDHVEHDASGVVNIIKLFDSQFQFEKNKTEWLFFPKRSSL